MLQRRRLVSVVAFLLVVACGGRPDRGGRDGGPFTASLVVTPATARLIAGGPPLDLSAAL